MKKKWTKPTVCQVPAGMEISRYQTAEIATRK
jgi:coenzyme PQQ precursor peptide PqqA